MQLYKDNNLKKSLNGDNTINKNILSIDVEDWYMNADISTWDLCEDRVIENTNKILNIVNRSNAKATFFIVGYVAEHYPELVRRIKDSGHEIATHGYSHKRITQQTPSEFEEDLIRSIKILENIIKEKVIGYRARQFTVVEETAWALDTMKKNGLKYDSSIFPIKTHIYGVPNAPLFPYRISSSNINQEADPEEEFMEIPLSIYKVPIINKNIPISGGFYFRLFPYWFIKYCIKKINSSNRPVIFYIHPWELDPGHPKMEGLRWYRFYNLSGTEKKFEKLLKDHKFTSIRDSFDFQ